MPGPIRFGVSIVLTIGRIGLAVNKSEWAGARMNNIMRVPVTAGVFAAMAVLLSGCIAYDAASTVVGAGTSVIGAAGDVVTSPFDSSDSDKK
jgi:hypothetical protein